MSKNRNLKPLTPVVANMDIINYANESDVTLAQLAEALGMKDTELSIMLRSQLAYYKTQDIKRKIDEIKNSNSEETLELEFISRPYSPKRYVRSSEDVSINVTKPPKSASHNITFTFRNAVWLSITDESNAIEIALTPKRLYFKASKNGYALYENKDSGNKYVKFRIDDKYVEKAEKFKGSFSLKKDDRLGLFYVEIENDNTV